MRSHDAAAVTSLYYAGRAAPTPLSILSNLLIWIDPAYCTTSIGKISSFTNRGSLGGTITQSTAASRSVRTASDARFNGLPSFASDGAVTFYDLPSLAALTSGESFVIAVLDADPAGTTSTSGWNLIGTNAATSHVPYTNGVVYEGFGSTTRPDCGNPASSLASPFLYNPWSAPNDFGLRINAAPLYASAVNTVGFSATPTLLRSYGAPTMLGSLAHFFLCGSKQSAGQRAAMEQWAKTACGITAIP